MNWPAGFSSAATADPRNTDLSRRLRVTKRTDRIHQTDFTQGLAQRPRLAPKGLSGRNMAPPTQVMSVNTPTQKPDSQ
jgi:hypothetical protein